MQNIRMIGYRISQYAIKNNVSNKDLSILLNCTENQIIAVMQGRCLLSYQQLCKLATHFNIKVDNLLSGYEDEYHRSIHCEGEFSNMNNKEKILNIIDEYVDIKNSLS